MPRTVRTGRAVSWLLAGVAVAGQARYQGAGGVYGAWPASAIGPGLGGVAARDQVAVPAQHRVRPHEQPHPMQHLRWQLVQ
jgi:hypothetical protein